MEREEKDCRRADDRHDKKQKISKLLVYIGCALVLVLLAGMARIHLTKEQDSKTQKTTQTMERAENEGYDNPERNPLKQEENSDITQAAVDYYARQTEETEFVEAYHNIQVYTKQGKYKDTYVVYARYDMKIRDIYTEVPGMGTLYAEKDKDGKGYQVTDEVADEETQGMVKQVTAQEDVQKLMSETQETYRQAVSSDVTLQESLAALENAYEKARQSE